MVPFRGPSRPWFFKPDREETTVQMIRVSCVQRTRLRSSRFGPPIAELPRIAFSHGFMFRPLQHLCISPIEMFAIIFYDHPNGEIARAG